MPGQKLPPVEILQMDPDAALRAFRERGGPVSAGNAADQLRAAYAPADWLMALQYELSPCRCPASHAVTGTCPAPACATRLADGEPVRMCHGCAEAAG